MVHEHSHAALTQDSMATRAARVGSPSVDPQAFRPLNAFEHDLAACQPLVDTAVGYVREALLAPSVVVYAERAIASLPNYMTLVESLHLVPAVRLQAQANGVDFWKQVLAMVEEQAGEELAEEIEQSVAIWRRAARLLQQCAVLPPHEGTEQQDLLLGLAIGGNIAIHAWTTDALFVVVSDTTRTYLPEIVAALPNDLRVSARRAYSLSRSLLELRQGEPAEVVG